MVAELPATHEKPIRHPSGNPNLAPPFTRDNAREMQRKSTLARLAAKQRTAQIDGAIPQLPDVQSARANVELQLKRLDEQLTRKLEPREWDMLTRAKDRLFKAWVHLISLPGPGTLKPTAARARRQPQSFEPLDPPAT